MGAAEKAWQEFARMANVKRHGELVQKEICAAWISGYMASVKSRLHSSAGEMERLEALTRKLVYGDA